MHLRAIVLSLLLAVPSFVFLAAAPLASAATGDDLVIGSNTIAPGNPCGASGHAGGVAVIEAGTAGRVLYSVQESRTIYAMNAYLPTTNPACTSFTPAVSGTDGWNALAYDAFRGLVWAHRFNTTGTIVAFTTTGIVRATFTHPGPVTGLAVDEASPNRLFVADGSATLAQYSVGPSPTYAIARLADVPMGYGAQHLASWDGALLAADAGDTVRNFQVQGAWLGMAFQPGYNWTDSWFELQRANYYFDDMAFDNTAYAPKGALWITSTSVGFICNGPCPQYQCVRYEGTTCLEQVCIANCNNGGYVYAPSLRAIEVVRACPVGAVPAPSLPCQCPSSVVAPLFLAPTNQVYLRGQPTGTPSAIPIGVQGLLTIEARGGPQDVVTLTGSGTAVGPVGGSAFVVLDSALLPRGAYVLTARSYSTQFACSGPSATIQVWLENPVLRTRSEALRVEGNVPLNLLAASVVASPADDLDGHETTAVTDQTASGDLSYTLDSFLADARHGPVAGAEQQLAADAQARVVGLDAQLQLDALCFTLTSQPACSVLPQVKLEGEALTATAGARMQLVTAAASASSSLVTERGAGNAIANLPAASVAVTHDVTPCPFSGLVTESGSVGGAYDAPIPPLPVPCQLAVGPFSVTFGETAQAVGPLLAEASATAVHIVVKEGPFRGEVLLATSYAGISLGGPGLLRGPPYPDPAPDDFQTGTDAPATPTGAPILAAGAYSGSFAGSDRADAFRIVAVPGEKLKVVLQPAHRTSLLLDPLPTLPAPGLAVRGMRLELFDPAGNLRDSSLLTGPADAQEIELNVDAPGPWGVAVTRLDTLVERAPYSVLATLAPVQLLDDGLPPAGDAPATCGGAFPLGPSGATVGGFAAGDDEDTFSFVLAAPGDLAATLDPLGDLEGANLDLVILSPSCSLLESSTNGAAPLPKGAPEALTLLNQPAGIFYAKVVRVNGLGNYHLQVAAVRPA